VNGSYGSYSIDYYSNDNLGNLAIDTYTIALIQRDIAVTGIVLSTNSTYVGRIIEVNVTLSNFGDIIESFNVSLYYDDTIINTTLVENMSPYTNTIITFYWDTATVEPCKYYNITAKADVLTGETNTTNNIYTCGEVKIKMLGDVNGDDKIDMIDIGVAARAFGTYPEYQPNPSSPGHRWNPEADINDDKSIDFRDIGLIARRFGRTCP